MAGERKLSDADIVKAFQGAATSQEELLRTVGKMHDALALMEERMGLLQEKLERLERRLARGRD